MAEGPHALQIFTTRPPSLFHPHPSYLSCGPMRLPIFPNNFENLSVIRCGLVMRRSNQAVDMHRVCQQCTGTGLRIPDLPAE